VERSSADSGLVPGAYVRHPQEEDWGIGQIQSVIGNRVTVNFEHRGKVMVLSDIVGLMLVDPSTEKRGNAR
jgi:Protein of unknown function (DUF3553)